jgi:hypothetical protein
MLPLRHPLLLWIGAGGLVLGVWSLWHLLKRLGRATFRRPQKPWGVGRYLFTLTTGAFLFGVGAASLGLWMAIGAFGDVRHKTHVAEIQAIELGPSKLRVYLVPLDSEGHRGATETYDVDGDEWTVGGDVMRFRPFLGHLGVDTVFQVTRVEGRWLNAEDANLHKPSAHDRATTGSGWLALYQHGTRGPLGWMVQGVNGSAVSQLPDRRTLYDLYVTSDGFVVDKKTM